LHGKVACDSGLARHKHCCISAQLSKFSGYEASAMYNKGSIFVFNFSCGLNNGKAPTPVALKAITEFEVVRPSLRYFISIHITNYTINMYLQYPKAVSS
jgi:hypothetical protein